MPGWVNFQSATLGQFCIGGNTAEAGPNPPVEAT